MQFPKNKHAPEGEPVYQIVEEFIDDHDIWPKDFLDAYQQMLSNGYEYLEDGPQNSWWGLYKNISIDNILYLFS